MSSMIACCWSSGICRMPKARFAVLWSAVITACEKYGGTAASSPRTRARVDDEAGLRNRSGSENAGHRSAVPQPRAVV